MRAGPALLASLALLVQPAPPARAQSCPGAPLVLGESHTVSMPAPVLLACRRDGALRMATRRVSVDGIPRLLLVDPQGLDTVLAPEACWQCEALNEDAFGRTRFGQTVTQALAATGKPLGSARQNAGLTGGQGEGAFLTADLCPSRKPLDRAILTRLAGKGPGTPVALAVSGAWLRAHQGDVRWLAERARAGELAITFVNHSDHHRYVPGVAPAKNFMTLPGTDATAEILGAERAMLAAGATPSVFFRFPGLIADGPLAQAAADLRLVNLGSNAWLALGQQPRPGSIILTHMNGNEPDGLARLRALLDQGRLGRLRPLNEAP